MTKKGRDPGHSKVADAMSAAFRLLSYRARSVKELAGRLAEKGFEPAEITRTLERLTQMGYLDDEAFAKELASWRIRNKNWGTRKIAFELGSKGVDPAIVGQVIGAIGEIEQLEAAKRTLTKWLNKKNSTLPLEKGVKKKALAYLQSKGFPTSIILSALNDL